MSNSAVLEQPNSPCVAPTLTQRLHQRWVHTRRTHTLAEVLSTSMSTSGKWLDVGCGDGGIDRMIMDRRSDVTITGLDVSARSATSIPVSSFDGLHIPMEADSFDGVLIVDVLHHTHHARELLSEIVRVARRQVVIKDVVADSWIEHKLLSFMDIVGNRPYGVPCPFTFLTRREWSDVFASLGYASPRYVRDFRLYPRPFSWLFDGRLHFVAVLDKPHDCEPTE